MSAHTPGPWTLKDDCRMGPRGDVTVSYVLESSDSATTSDFVAFIDGGEWERHEAARVETAHANARLIAAAPDLLDAVQQLRALAQREGWIHVAIQAADAAIAKAEGK